MTVESVRFGGARFDSESEVVDLVNVSVTDLAPLAELPRLRVLRLEYTNPHRRPISMPFDLEPLRGAQRLEVLVLPRTAIDDLEPLRALPALRELDVSFTRVVDLSPLASITSLIRIGLRATRVFSIAPLAGLNALQDLDVAHTAVNDLSPLHGLAQLARLDVDETPIDQQQRKALKLALPDLELIG